MADTILAGKTVLLIGATGGIGAAVAPLLAQEGARLILSGRNSQKLEAVAASVTAVSGAAPLIIKADITDNAQITSLFEEAEKYAEGAIDIVINAAGIGTIKPIESLTPADFYNVLSINLYGPMLLSRAAVKAMAPRKSGHILHVVGILGKAPMANATAYCASKYGLTGFLQSLRAEVSRRHNIKITGLYLGGVDTPFYDNPNIEMKVQRDKMLTPGDAARAIHYALTQPAHLVLGELTLQPESHQL